MELVVEFFTLHWRTAAMVGLCCATCLLIAWANKLRPVILIFGLVGLGIVAKIDRPGHDTALAMLSHIKSGIFRAAPF